MVDLSASPLTQTLALVAWPKLMRRDNVDLMVLCIDYPSPSCCLVGVCCQVYLAAVGFMNTNPGIISRCGQINDPAVNGSLQEV